jgi:hypothetical protein
MGVTLTQRLRHVEVTSAQEAGNFQVFGLRWATGTRLDGPRVARNSPQLFQKTENYLTAGTI